MMNKIEHGRAMEKKKFCMLAGQTKTVAVLRRKNFYAYMLFVPLWLTYSYTLSGFTICLLHYPFIFRSCRKFQADNRSLRDQSPAFTDLPCISTLSLFS
ncbi:uncharacterized protein [Rutidosis leptorrhynchoides]|uniref:uncharacterized protein isoform X2 n=1 Tax=Rutidosis leptorrhynchoides TaxID=125765 RepID=UPI003A9A5075